MKYKLLHIIAALALVSCSSAEVQPEEPDARPVLFSPESPMSFTSQAFSRDGSSASEDPQSVKGILPETCGLFGEMENYTNDIFYNQIVYRKDGSTYADPAIKSGVEAMLKDFIWPEDNNWIYAPLRYWSGNKSFQFYCYAPHSSVEGTSVNLTSNSYGAMTNFQMSRIPPYSSYDYTVADEYKYQTHGTVPFNMKHVSARICLRMKIGDKYAQMRKIKIKEVSVNDRTVGGTYFLCSVSLNEDKTQNEITVTSNGEYKPASDDSKILIIPIFNNASGLELSSDDYQQFGSLYVMPQTITTLTVNVTYDVYDNVDDDVPTRVNQRVTNTISFKDANGLFRTVKSGYYYEINILVSPEYLYVLSDNDIKPDMLISPE